MQIVNFLSSLAMPFIILLIVTYGLLEKRKVFDDFLEGAKEGIEIVFNILPTLVGLFVAIGALRNSGVLDIIIRFITPLLNVIHFPSEIMPLAMLRPISGSGSIAVATDIMKNYGVDTTIGIIASTIMGSTETTLYTIAVYTSCVKIRKTRFVLLASLTADVVGIVVSVIICQVLWKEINVELSRKVFVDKWKKLGYNSSMLTKILLFISIFFIVRKIVIHRFSKEIQKKISN